VSRRLSCLLPLALLFGLTASPAVAQSLSHTRILVEKSSHDALATIFLAHGLLPGRRYQLLVRSPHHASFTVIGFENYSFVSNRQFHTGEKNLNLRGHTPHVILLSQPLKGHLRSWTLAVTIHLTSGQGLTVKVVDSGYSP
jgi:hypothetical protein